MAVPNARRLAQVYVYEQALIDALKPSLNSRTCVISKHRLVSGDARGARAHASAKPVSVLDLDGRVLYVYGSRARATAGLSMSHRSLKDSLGHGKVYRGALQFRELCAHDVILHLRYTDHGSFLAYVASVRLGPTQWSARAQPVTVGLVQPDGCVGDYRDYPSVRAASRDLLPHLPWAYLRDHVAGSMRRPYRGWVVVTRRNRVDTPAQSPLA